MDLKDSLSDIQKKAKERTVRTQNIEYDLETLVKKIQKNVIKLNPEYQRKHRWSDGFSSRLIESLILNIPIPIVYISQDIDVDEEVEDDIARYSVIDGQQRLTAIYSFFKNKYALEGMEVLTELNGLKYSELPPFLIRRLEERSVKCLRIDSTIDTQVKYDIFERLNSGSVKLEAQELRNATCRGPFKTLIKKLSKNANFTKLCNLEPDSFKVKKMEDEELVLRFFALTYNNGYKEYKGQFKKFLTAKMDEFNGFDEATLEGMEKSFIEVFDKIKDKFGNMPFQKYRSVDGGLKLMSNFNAAVFDSLVVAVFLNIKSDKGSSVSFQELFHNEDYFASIEGSVNDAKKITTRIDLVSEILK
ncbi:DUF262 domain-containing protein [Maribacter sp. BPC-D8]|uniref:DUF262 domain-containing protein n=1 Tax=Maribacter sp. BPC-D8 TaxID=3053613 RepID=UPI002B4A0CB7|nr:DUF262 domain-containing protein [Maribacter sp. BPC-D8]WRI30969.1 DUF262 domain-containing protein [Maribacter sp. BPC-D8]